MGSLEVEKTAIGWAARDPSGVLSPYTYTLRYLLHCGYRQCGFISSIKPSNSCLLLYNNSIYFRIIYELIIFFFKMMCRNTGPDDVQVKVLYCGLCHSDLHQVKNDLGMSNYPMVPG